MDFRDYPLENQVAQLFMVGYAGAEPNAITRRFFEVGVGGLIFFRDNFDALASQSPRAVLALLSDLSSRIPAHLPKMLLGIDQEGGQVERLPHTLFPTALSPLAVALAKEPDLLAHEMYTQLAEGLVALGFNLDFFPTLDVNVQLNNPIIGVRSFGSESETVWRYAQIAMKAFELAGLIAVGKHFPGHGNGTVDSHLDLPTLQFSGEELWPFQQAIARGLPAMLVAHGFYPALQTTETERALPSSASPAVIQTLLRQRCGYNGVIITDDMCMGAITKHRSPVEAALSSLKAGVDILLYKQTTDDEWQVYEAVLNAFATGELPLTRLYESLGRIAQMKQVFSQERRRPDDASKAVFSVESSRLQSEGIALKGVSILSGNPDVLPLNLQAPLLLVHPERQLMGNYAFDAPTSADLDQLYLEAGFQKLQAVSYPPKASFSVPDVMTRIQEKHGAIPPETICLITFNPRLQRSQMELFSLLQANFPNANIILISAGMPDSNGSEAMHLALCSYRPASMRALAQVMATGL